MHTNIDTDIANATSEQTSGSPAPADGPGRSDRHRAPSRDTLPVRRHLPAPTGEDGRHLGVVLDVVVPVYNEEAGLEGCVRRLHAFLSGNFPYGFRITVADNASVDGTPVVARFAEVESVRLEEKGPGRRRGR
ncbi:hypothetical protein GCM10027091_16350 [Streptomyces daliensis]